MSTFIGREQEQAEFRELLEKKNSSLVTCHGRRRIGKSRFIRECAKQANTFFEFSGLPPRPGLTKKEQLSVFAEQLAKQSKAPRLPLDSWATAFQLLASQLPPKGTVVLLFDEISWMGIGETDFAGYIKNAWDDLFSRRDRTVVVLCGSVLYAGPYHQSKTQRQHGCQIDLLIQTNRSTYLCEIKFKRHINTSVSQEVDRKVSAIKLPKTQSIRTALIYDGELASSIEEEQAFDFLIPSSELFVI